MSIRKKIMLLLVLPIFGLAVFVIFSSYLLNDISSNLRKATSETFSPMLNKDLPEINTLNLDIILLLNADRDAYQAHLAELKSSIAQTVPEQKKAAKFNMENLLQIEQRTNSIKSISSKREKALFVQFKDKYAEWKKYTRAAIRTDENILRLKQRPDTDPLVLKNKLQRATRFQRLPLSLLKQCAIALTCSKQNLKTELSHSQN